MGKPDYQDVDLYFSLTETIVDPRVGERWFRKLSKMFGHSKSCWFLHSPDDKPATLNLEGTGEFHQALMSNARSSSNKSVERVLGSAEVRNRDFDVSVVVNFDTCLVRRTGQTSGWGNSVVVQCRDRHLGDESYKQMFREMCGPGVAWARASSLEEFDHKNLEVTEDYIRAVGLDFSKFLPGVYWMNFFGAIYVDLIGLDRLEAAEGPVQHEVVDGGVIVQLFDQSSAWNTAEGRAREASFRDSIGREFLFERGQQRSTIIRRVPKLFSDEGGGEV